LAAAVLLAVFAGWMALHYIRERPQRADVEKWRSLSEKTTTWLKERNFAEIKKTENAVLTSVASRPAAVFFARFAINCAKSRRMGMYGDPYVFLLKAEEVLGNDVNDPNLPTVLYDLANEQFLINSYHRAFRLLELIPEDRRSSEAKALHTQLTTLFTIFRTTTAELDKTIAATSGDQAISRQLRDLLGILPQNFAYSEQSLVSDHAGSQPSHPLNSSRRCHKQSIALNTKKTPLRKRTSMRSRIITIRVWRMSRSAPPNDGEPTNC
jgi:hypothetical protein